nr:ribonuclease H-like domain-containing protein [Tanacetum cinerariifolium]
MKLEHYLSHTDYPIWHVIQNGNGPVSVTTYTNEIIKVLPPKTAEEVVARERERKARITLLMALPEDHLGKFHKMADAKEMWKAIKSRFGGNDESKKMQKYLLKQQFEGFFVSSLKGLHKGYDRFQTLLSQLEIYGTGVSHVDANQNFDDLYNNLRVFERDVKGTTASSSNTHNVAFVSANNTRSTNDVSTAYSVSSPSVLKSQKEGSSSYTNEVAMISIRIKKFHKRTRRKLQFDTKDSVGFDKTKVKCFNSHKMRHFSRDYRPKGNQDNKKRDAWYNGNKSRDNGRRTSGHVKEDAQNYAMMAYSSSNSGSDNEVKSYSKACEESYARLKKLYDDLRDKLGDASVEITAYTLALRKTSADESYSKPSEYASCESDSSVETSTSMPKPIENALKVVCKPQVWTDAPIIEEEYNNETGTTNHSPKIENQDRNGHTRKGLGYAFTRKECFVCGSFSHLIRDCNFHEKRIAKQAELTKRKNKDDPHRALKDKGIVDSGCSRHMTGNKAHLADYQEFKGGSVAFGGSNGRITGKGKIKANRLDFEGVYYVEELKHYNLFSVSQMCNKKNKVLFTDTDYLVMSLDFKLSDEDQNKDLIELCGLKGIKKEYSNARTLQQNRVAERKNRTLIDAARTMLADSFLPTTFWAEAVNTACYVLNRVLVAKPQNKTPYELLTSKQAIISYLRPFGCHVTILNTIDQLGKFDGKSDLGFLVGHSLNSKAFRVYNLETKRVEENLHVNFLENKPNVAGKGHA